MLEFFNSFAQANEIIFAHFKGLFAVNSVQNELNAVVLLQYAWNKPVQKTGKHIHVCRCISVHDCDGLLKDQRRVRVANFL